MREVKSISLMISALMVISLVLVMSAPLASAQSEITTIAPTSGPVGTLVTVTGSGFAGESVITITWDGGQIETVPEEVITEPDGTFTATVTVPPTTAGEHTIEATDEDGNSASMTFTVGPEIALTPEEGSVGTEVTIAGSGFAAESVITVTWAGDTIETVPETVMTGLDGSFTATIVVPSALADEYTITAEDAEGNSASATFTIEPPTIEITPTSGPVSTEVTVTGSGFTPWGDVRIYFDGTLVASTTADEFGALIPATFEVPDVQAGDYGVYGYDMTAGTTTDPVEFTIPTPFPWALLVAVIAVLIIAAATIGIWYKRQQKKGGPVKALVQNFGPAPHFYFFNRTTRLGSDSSTSL